MITGKFFYVILQSIHAFIQCKLDLVLLFVVYNGELHHLLDRLFYVCYHCTQQRQMKCRVPTLLRTKISRTFPGPQ